MEQSSNEMRDVIDKWIKGATDNVHTALPGTIVSYDAGAGQVSAQPFGAMKLPDGRALPYPIIHHIPVIFPTGLRGAAGVTFPLQAGDGCLLVFSEAQLDDFLHGGDSDNERTHSMNDAICIPGMYSAGGPRASAYPNDVCIYNRGCLMRIGSGGITVTGGDVVVEGISVTTHTHTGDSGGTTSAPK